MKPKLLAVDLDGTLLHRSGVPHEADRRALLALQRSGAVVTIATGRLYPGTRDAAHALELLGPVACADGSHVVAHHDGSTVFHHGIATHQLDQLRAGFASGEASVFLFGTHSIVHDARGESFLPYIRTWSDDVVRVPDALTAPVSEDLELTAFVALASEEQVKLAAASLAENPDSPFTVATFAVKHLGDRWGFLARSAGRSKGTALRWLAEHHGLGIEQTVVVGDWHNDVPMFEVAGRSFAMGHAPDDVKAKASDVLPEDAESGGGIARIVREVFDVDV